MARSHCVPFKKITSCFFATSFFSQIKNNKYCVTSWRRTVRAVLAVLLFCVRPNTFALRFNRFAWRHRVEWPLWRHQCALLQPIYDHNQWPFAGFFEILRFEGQTNGGTTRTTITAQLHISRGFYRFYVTSRLLRCCCRLVSRGQDALLSPFTHCNVLLLVIFRSDHSSRIWATYIVLPSLLTGSNFFIKSDLLVVHSVQLKMLSVFLNIWVKTR